MTLICASGLVDVAYTLRAMVERRGTMTSSVVTMAGGGVAGSAGGRSDACRNDARPPTGWF